MASFATFKHNNNICLYNIGIGKRRISKPPGGGTSNIFSANDDAATPRSVKNHMRSNIFATPPNGNNGADARRPRHDSHARLFGEVERQFPGSEKNYMKSSIPINNTKPIASNENENTNEQRDNRKIEDSIKKSLDDHDSSAAQMNIANKNRVPPGGFSSILW